MLGSRSTARLPSGHHARLRTMVDEHLKTVARTLRRAGVPSSDLDDEIQRTFIVAAKRIDDIQVGAERSFLIQVAQNLAWHARRKIARLFVELWRNDDALKYRVGRSVCEGAHVWFEVETMGALPHRGARAEHEASAVGEPGR